MDYGIRTYEKKTPTHVKAIQYDGENKVAVQQLLNVYVEEINGKLIIDDPRINFKGPGKINKYDYVIKGEDGYFFKLSNKAFHNAYKEITK